MKPLAILPAFLLALLCAPRLAAADPALFVARAPGLTAYLLGSFHALKPGTEWMTPAIRRALGASSECWFEVVVPHDPHDLSVSLQRGLDPQARLPTLLSSTDNARLRLWADTLHVPGGVATLDQMRPWMVFVTLMAAEVKTAGLEADSGVEAVLQAQARRDWKVVIGLETLDEHLDIFANQPEPAILRMLHDGLTKPPGQAAGKPLDTLLHQWLNGDIDALGAEVNEAGRELGPSMYDALLLRRNRAWAERLDHMRGRNTTILVTVGAGHLAGPGNLRELLQERQFVVERVQP